MTLGLGVGLPSGLTFRGAKNILPGLSVSLGISPPLKKTMDHTIKEKQTKLSDFKVGAPTFKIDGLVTYGPNLDMQLVHFPWQKAAPGWYYGGGFALQQLQARAQTRTHFLVCDAMVDAPCSQQDAMYETLTEGVVDAKFKLQFATFDIMAGKQFKAGPMEVFIQLGWAFTFWKNLASSVSLAIDNSEYETDFDENIDYLIAYENQELNSQMRHHILGQPWFIKYMPVLNVFVMF